MKKVSGILVASILNIIILCCVNNGDVYAATATISFGSTSYSKEKTEEFPVGIYVKCDDILGAHAVRIKYDTKKLRYISGATSVSDGTLILKGSGGKNSVKYWLEFEAINGGDSSMVVEAAKVYAKNNTEVALITSLPSASINVTGTDTYGLDNGTVDYTIAQTANPNIDSVLENELLDNKVLNTQEINDNNGVNSDSLEQNSEIDEYQTEEPVEEIEYEESVDNNSYGAKDKEEKDNFLLYVILNLVLFGGLTALGILIVNLIAKKINKKRRFEQEFEEEFIREYSKKPEKNEDVDDENMKRIPIDEFSDSRYNNENVEKYTPEDDDLLERLDVEFVCDNSIMQKVEQTDETDFEYIEHNLELNLEKQIMEQMKNA